MVAQGVTHWVTQGVTQSLLQLSLVIVGVVHLLPGLGALGADRLEQLYGVGVSDPSLLLLLQHRAVLFAVIGSLCLTATIVVPLRLPALLMALISVLAYLLLSRSLGPVSTELARVATVDLWLLPVLAVGLSAWFASLETATSTNPSTAL
ncbi:MAG: phosphopantetheine adenylyltransferase [Pseudomonadota bacterium]